LILRENRNFLSEGLYYIDEEPLRAFFLIDVESASVEITDFRILWLDNARDQRLATAG
jgi:hypothetical protein